MRSLNGVVLAAIAIVAIIVATMSTFVVDPTEQALILPHIRSPLGRLHHDPACGGQGLRKMKPF
jgi:hypothetical protein